MSLCLVLEQNSIKESKQINPNKTKQNNNFLKKKEKRDSIQVKWGKIHREDKLS